MSNNETIFKPLILAAQQGDAVSYSELLKGISSFLKSYLRKRIFEKNEIDEVIQEILMSVHKSLHTYDYQKSFMSWLLAITEYKIVDHIRSFKKHSGQIELNEISNFLNISNSDLELKLEIEKAMMSLSDRERNVISRLKIQGESVLEVAQQLKLTEANVKVIAHRAYLNLRTFLGNGS